MPVLLSVSSKGLPCLRIWRESAPGLTCPPWHCLIPTASPERRAFTWQRKKSESRRTTVRKSRRIHHGVTESQRKTINNQQSTINNLIIPPCHLIFGVDFAFLSSFPPAP